MRWVDVRSYIGLDRRRGGFRLFDRRAQRSDANPPSLTTALRQLRMTCADADDRKGFDAFSLRARGVAGLAEVHGQAAVSLRLLQLVQTLESKADAGEFAAVVEMLERVMPEIEASADTSPVR